MVTSAAASSGPWSRTEVEALQLEYSWIKEFDPRFNVKYRDDKSYPSLAVTLNEEFPRLQVMRGPKKKGVRYFGPYSPRLGDPGDPRPAAAGLPGPHLLGRASSSGPVRSAAPACSATSASARRRASAGSSADEHRQIVEDFCDFMAGQTDDVPAPAREGHAGRGGQPGVRAGGPAARRHQGPRAGDGEAVGGARGRHRRRRRGLRRGPARGRGSGLLRPRRPDPRAARLGRRQGRGPHHRRPGRALPAAGVRRVGDRARRARLGRHRPAGGAGAGDAARRRGGAGLADARCAAATSTCGCRSAATSGP